jgi:hypothetical protein
MEAPPEGLVAALDLHCATLYTSTDQDARVRADAELKVCTSQGGIHFVANEKLPPIGGRRVPGIRPWIDGRPRAPGPASAGGLHGACARKWLGRASPAYE